MFYVIFTDLDGTLLDHDTYEWKAAGPALELCGRLQVPIILVSSKTRAEMEPLRSALGLKTPFVVENGGAVFFDAGDVPPEGTLRTGDLWVWHLGEPYAKLVQALKAIREETAIPLKGFADMTLAEIARLTGLDIPGARLAAMREYDEPFIVGSGVDVDIEALEKATRKRGLQVLSGGRFFHLQGRNDKGRAVRMLIDRYRRQHASVVSIALGDSPNDFSMLEQADLPVLVRSAKDFGDLRMRIPRLRVSSLLGPHGWNEVVLGILGEI